MTNKSTFAEVTLISQNTLLNLICVMADNPSGALLPSELRSGVGIFGLSTFYQPSQLWIHIVLTLACTRQTNTSAYFLHRYISDDLSRRQLQSDHHNGTVSFIHPLFFSRINHSYSSNYFAVFNLCFFFPNHILTLSLLHQHQ